MQRRKSRRLHAVSTAIAAGLVGVTALASCGLARPAQARVGAAPLSLGADTVSFPSASGSVIHAWFARGHTGAGAVLLLHGVGADRRAMADRARFLHGAGYSVLIPDFQAHGESAGAHITFGALESLDAAAALDYLHAHAPGERAGVIGVSMGGAAALVGPNGPLPVDALVLESVYPTIRDAVRDRLRAWLGPLGPALTSPLLSMVGREIGVSPAALRPLDRIARVGAPVLIAAGTDDRYTPIAETRALYASAPAPKELWVVAGAGHVDLHAFAPAEYERRVGGFLARVLRPAQATAHLAPAAGTRG
jgi:fermentation-respiration switch protein FrsA (DUF1100 family)